MVEQLIAEEGTLKGLTLSFQDGQQWIIGRDPDACQLLIEDPAVSRKHLLCRREEQGITVQNLSETNPVVINDHPLEDTQVLQEGDLIKIGNGTFRFVKVEKNGTEVPSPPKEEQSPTGEEPQIKEEKMVETAQTETPQAEAPPGIEDLEEEEEKHPSIYEEETPKEETQIAKINFDLLETGRWLLKVVGGPNNGAEFSMVPGKSYIIGTDPNTCDIVFHDTSVSRQHVRLTITEDEQIQIEDLKSRNGTLVNGVSLQGKEPLSPNIVVSVGTTSFVIYDREGNMQTIISPLLPSIVKVLQKEEEKPEDATKVESEKIAPSPLETAVKKEKPLGAFILIAILTGLFVILGIGTTTLFKSQPIVTQEPSNIDEILSKATSPFPGIKYSFNKNTGRLLIVGHVLTPSDKNQLMYNLQGIPFIKSIDDSGEIIDEYVWQEINVVLNKNPNWRGISVQSPTPGQFILTGYLNTRKEADLLYEYIASNFPYLDRMEKQVIVTEEVMQTIENKLLQNGFPNVKVRYQYGDAALSGSIPKGTEEKYKAVVNDIKKMPSIRTLVNQVQEKAPELSVINISDRYEVSGYSSLGNKISVVINGRIVSVGDVIDAMTITDITPGAIFLDKEGVRYRIDFTK